MDPLEWMNKRKADEAERKKALAEAQEEVMDAEARVKQLEDRILRIKNPLLARTQATMTEEESAEWQGQNSTARIAMTERQLEEAKVADVAELLGFTEASSFVRSFKSWTGQTPRGYRDRMESLGER